MANSGFTAKASSALEAMLKSIHGPTWSLVSQPSSDPSVFKLWSQPTSSTAVRIKTQGEVDATPAAMYQVLRDAKNFEGFFPDSKMTNVMALTPPHMACMGGAVADQFSLYHCVLNAGLPVAVRDWLLLRICLPQPDGSYIICSVSIDESASLPRFPNAIRGVVQPSGILLHPTPNGKCLVTAMMDFDFCGTLPPLVSRLTSSPCFGTDLCAFFLSKISKILCQRNCGPIVPPSVGDGVAGPLDASCFEESLLECLRAGSAGAVCGWQSIASDEGFEAFSRLDKDNRCGTRAIFSVDAEPGDFIHSMADFRLISSWLPPTKSSTVLEDKVEPPPSSRLREMGFGNFHSRILLLRVKNFEYCIKVAYSLNVTLQTSFLTCWSVDHPSAPADLVGVVRRGTILPCGALIGPNVRNGGSQVAALLRLDLSSSLSSSMPFATAQRCFLQSFVMGMRWFQKANASVSDTTPSFPPPPSTPFFGLPNQTLELDENILFSLDDVDKLLGFPVDAPTDLISSDCTDSFTLKRPLDDSTDSDDIMFRPLKSPKLEVPMVEEPFVEATCYQGPLMEPVLMADATARGVSVVSPANVHEAPKGRLLWTDELHERFVEVVESLGIEVARPQKILKAMNVAGLTADHVKSHLQKFRSHWRKQQAKEKELEQFRAFKKSHEDTLSTATDNAKSLLKTADPELTLLASSVITKAAEFQQRIQELCDYLADKSNDKAMKAVSSTVMSKASLSNAEEMRKLALSLERYSQQA